MDALPTDQEYLNEINDEFGEYGYSYSDKSKDELYERAKQYCKIRGEIFVKEEWMFVEELGESDKLLDGHYANMLKDEALKIIGDERKRLKEVPVAVLPSEELQGSAFRTPRNGAIIVINHGLIVNINALMGAYMGMYTLYEEPQIRRQFSEGEYTRDIHLLTMYIVYKDDRILGNAESIRSGEVTDIDKFLTPMITSIACSFIMLHEYAHIILGHLNPEDTISINLKGKSPKQVYQTNHDMEYEADEFALKYLLKGAFKNTAVDDKYAMKYLAHESYRENMVVFAVGFLMRIFDYCERHTNNRKNPFFKEPFRYTDHPPAMKRWHRIKEIYHAGITTSHDRAFRQTDNLLKMVDPAFDMMIDIGFGQR